MAYELCEFYVCDFVQKIAVVEKIAVFKIIMPFSLYFMLLINFRYINMACKLCEFIMQQFQSFLEAEGITINDNIKEYVSDLQKQTLSDLTTNNVELQKIIDRFEEYQAQTLEGLHGKTQQYYAIYIQLIHYYLMFERSIRTANFELFCYIITKMSNILFTFYQQNYARWLAWYNDTLLNIEQTHPGLKDECMRGGFGIKRTNKPFFRVPIDLTLEQINADAGRRLTGIIHLTNSIGARQRWSLNHGIRCASTSAAIDECGLTTKQDITNDLQSNRINKSKTQTQLHMRPNPFAPDVRKDALISIATG